MSAVDFIALFPAFARDHAAPLVVVIPLIAGAVAALAPGARAAWGFVLGAAAASAALSLLLLAQTTAFGPVTYDLGGWSAPLGITYFVDPLNAMVLTLVSGVAVLCAIYAPRSVEAEIPPRSRGMFYAAFSICFAGLMGVAITGDAFNLFVFLEISSLSTYVLVGMGASRDRRALPAAYNYLILGTIGATFYVIGVGFLYAATGTLNLAEITARLAEAGDLRTVRAGFAFIVIGLGLKLALYPLHAWLPNAYAFAPSFVTAFLAATATKVAFYALARFVYSVFGPAYEFKELTLLYLFAPLAIAGMLVASFQAVFQTDARRLLAYSSVAQVGYMLLGLATATVAGLSAGLLHLFNHALMKGGLFMALGAASMRLGVTQVQDFRGLGRTMPFTMAAFAICALSLVGVPLTAGFISKWYLLLAVLESDWWWAAAAIAAASVLGLVYVFRVLEAAYLRPPPERSGAAIPAQTAPWTMLVPMWAFAIASIWFGVDASWPEGLARCAAAAVVVDAPPCALTGGAP